MASPWTPKYSMREVDRMLSAKGSVLETENRLIDGRMQRVYKNLFPSLRLFWLGMTSLHGDKISVTCDGQEYTYREMLSLSLKYAGVLKDVYGVKKGDRVGICAANDALYIVAFFASHLLGAVAVLINGWLPVDPLKRCLHLTECTVVFVDAKRADILDPFVSEFGGCTFLTLNSTETRWNNVKLMSGALKSYRGSPAHILKDDPCIVPEDNATILFTSGTSGTPKGVLSTQRMFLTGLFNVGAVVAREMLRGGEPFPPPPAPLDAPQKAFACPVPLFHATGMSIMLVAILEGLKLVIVKKWNVVDAASELTKEKVSGLAGVPTMISDLIDSRYADMADEVERMTYGGAPVSPALLERTRNAFPNAKLAQGYGLTETNAYAIGIAGQDFYHKPASTGVPVLVGDAIIVKDGQEVPVGHLGEVWVRGPNVMKEYWRDPEATAKALTKDGWFKTGDLALMDEEGFVFIKDRLKDIIIRGGENVDSVTVENALYTNPNVLEAAAVGIPDDRLGELVAAVVSIKPGCGGKVSETSLLETVSTLLPRFAIPSIVVIQEHAFEQTASGKVLKGPLKAIARKAWDLRVTSSWKAKL